MISDSVTLLRSFNPNSSFHLNFLTTFESLQLYLCATAVCLSFLLFSNLSLLSATSPHFSLLLSSVLDHRRSWELSLFPGHLYLIPDVLDLRPPGDSLLLSLSPLCAHCPRLSLPLCVCFLSPVCVNCVVSGFPRVCLCSLSSFQVFMVEESRSCGSGLFDGT